MPWAFHLELPSNIAIDHLIWTHSIEQRKTFTNSNFFHHWSMFRWILREWRFPLLIQSPSLVVGSIISRCFGKWASAHSRNLGVSSWGGYFEREAEIEPTAKVVLSLKIYWGARQCIPLVPTRILSQWRRHRRQNRTNLRYQSAKSYCGLPVALVR